MKKERLTKKRCKVKQHLIWERYEWLTIFMWVLLSFKMLFFVFVVVVDNKLAFGCCISSLIHIKLIVVIFFLFFKNLPTTSKSGFIFIQYYFSFFFVNFLFACLVFFMLIKKNLRVFVVVWYHNKHFTGSW